MTVDESVEAGTKIILRILLISLIAAFLYLVRDVVLLIFLAVLTSAAVAPGVMRLKRAGLTRTTAVIVTYSVLFTSIAAMLSFLIPIFLTEIRDFVSHWPQYSVQFGKTLSSVEIYLQALGIDFHKEIFFANIENGVADSFTGIFSTTVSIFSRAIAVFGFFFLSLYISLEEKGIEKFFLLLTPERFHNYALSLAERMSGKVSQWLFGQLILMLIIFGIYFLGLSLMGVPYALALAFFGGVMEIIPYVGPIIAAIPALALGFAVSPLLGLSVLAFYLIAHQLEGHIIAPQVLKRSIGLNPVVLIIAALIGAELGGPLGILLAVPTAMMLSVFVEDFLNKKEVGVGIK